MNTKQTVAAVQEFTNAYIAKALETKGQVNFTDIRDAVNAAFPGAKFNWLTAVRSPMQGFINAGKMKRIDVEQELYLAQ